MTPVRFEPTIAADERSQTYALDRAATGTGHKSYVNVRFIRKNVGNCSFCYPIYTEMQMVTAEL
jgi:hypothetical protein